MLTTLNTIPILEVSKIGIAASLITMASGFIILRRTIDYECKSDRLFVIQFILGLVFFILGAIGACNFALNDAWKNDIGRVRIEATISDDMTFNSIYDQYEIIEKRGDIYQLEPKVFDIQQEDDKL